MGFQILGATLDVQVECECGYEDNITVYDADELIGNSFTLLGFSCPVCGRELENDS